jgi:hypothetical protein
LRVFLPDHTLELPKLGTLVASEVEADPAPIDWGRFFAAGTERELEDLVMQRPEMAEPVKALTQLSADDKARIAAFERECAVGGWNHIMNATREEGEARGRAEGKAEGKADTLLAILAAQGLRLSSEQRELILRTRDPLLLDKWVLRALSAQAAEAIFEP